MGNKQSYTSVDDTDLDLYNDDDFFFFLLFCLVFITFLILGFIYLILNLFL